MHCPQCHKEDTRVIDSRLMLESNSIKRRRKCDSCDTRFTTYETVQWQMPQVLKKDGRRENFNREKIMKGLKKACQKRPISADQLNKLIDEVERSLIESNPVEVTGPFLGELVMDRLRKLDTVSYVRFASFYWDYKDIEDFVFGLRHNLNCEKTITCQNSTQELN